MEQTTQSRIDNRVPRAAFLAGARAARSEWWERGDEGGVPSRLLLVGMAGPGPEQVAANAMQRAGWVVPADAAARIRTMVCVDVVWLTAAQAIESATLAGIFEAVAECGCGLLCETSLVALDRVAAAIPEGLRAELLVDADATDRRVALAAAQRRPAIGVNDQARDETMERIDRLQDEVARIARLLGDIAGQRGLPGTPAGPVSHDEVAEPGGQLRSPPRNYAGMPRSFEPEERTIQRQRAKAVRRMLRQRRMREQYFPADLFADPAWDMLLDLYAARLERQPVSVSSLCIAGAVPATTALRWIKTMTDAGLFLREADPHDGRRIFIGLAEAAHDAMARYFEALEE